MSKGGREGILALKYPAATSICREVFATIVKQPSEIEGEEEEERDRGRAKRNRESLDLYVNGWMP